MVPSCDSVPIVHVNEPFNRIGSFMNVTTLGVASCTEYGHQHATSMNEKSLCLQHSFFCRGLYTTTAKKAT